MTTNTQFMRDRLLAGVDGGAVGDKIESLESLSKTEWNDEFERLMRNRLIMGRFRYGRMDRKEQTNYDRIRSAIKRLRHYARTGNTEHLVDVANMMVMEWVHGDHPNKHFEADDDGEHTERTY